MTARAMLAQLQDARLAAEDDEEAGGVGPALARREEDAEQQPVSGAAGGDGDAGRMLLGDDEAGRAPTSPLIPFIVESEHEVRTCS